MPRPRASLRNPDSANRAVRFRRMLTSRSEPFRSIACPLCPKRTLAAHLVHHSIDHIIQAVSRGIAVCEFASSLAHPSHALDEQASKSDLQRAMGLRRMCCLD